tara:strand:- start:945 stop:1421 length:477 start_codon:yes stop_codon:yes gene_type:complete
MRKLLLAAVLLMNFAANAHIGKIAVFKYTQVESTIQLEVIIDHKYAVGFGESINNGCDFNGLTALCMSKYILENTSLIINDSTTIVFEIADSKIEKGHLIMNFSAKLSNPKIEAFQIENKCFVPLDKAFRNRVKINFDNYRKSYMLKGNNFNIQKKLN